MDERRAGASQTTLPISAMVGADMAKDAIMCGLCSRNLHTILITGRIGTGKSVVARSVTGITDRKVINITAGSTPDQIFGDVDFEAVLSGNVEKCCDSILARANGNVLVIDDADLLPEGTLQAVLNSVESGYDGNACQLLDTLLIATTNSMEESLSGHVLDRFDMCVYMDTADSPSDRKEIVRTNIAFERDPNAFIEAYAEEQRSTKERILEAEPDLVHIPEDLMGLISEISEEMHVEGHRGDVAVANVSRALASLKGHNAVWTDDLKEAVVLCLQHRRRDASPEQQVGKRQEQESDSDGENKSNDDSNEPSDEGSCDKSTDGEPDNSPRNEEQGDEANEGNNQQPSGEDRVFSVGKTFDVKEYIPPVHPVHERTRAGYRDEILSHDASGHCIGHVPPRGKPRDIALVPSIRAAAPFQKSRVHDGRAIVIKREDIREKVRTKQRGTSIMFVVDGSGSMGAHDRMIAVKGAILSLLTDAYKHRDEVGLTVFKSNGADTVVPLTRSVQVAYRSLAEMPTGGKTPLAAGLLKGYESLATEINKGMVPVMVILTDGRGNVGVEGDTPSESLAKATRILAESEMRVVVVDTESSLMRFGKALELSESLNADYIQLEQLDARSLATSVRTAINDFNIGD